MRSARYKTIPRTIKKVPYGISRQRELLDLVERRLAQAELIRCAVLRTQGSPSIPTLAEDESAPPRMTAPAGEKPAASAQTAPAEENLAASTQTTPAGEKVAASTQTTPAGEKPAADDTASAIPSAQTTPAISNDTAPASADTPTDLSDDAASASADTPTDLSDDTAPASDAPLCAVTFLWHGKEETVEHPEVWLAIFDDVKDAGDAITRELVRRRFRDEPYWKTCDALYLSHSAYYHNIREILHYTLACATAYGILDPRPKHPSENA